MRGMTFLLFVALTIVCWGLYGITIHVGQEYMGYGGRLSRWRPFVGVGLAYFLIAVLFPLVFLRFQKEKGYWSAVGSGWSFFAGIIGALGALGIILAFTFGGSPIYVMPLVFGLAPVVNTITTMAMAATFRHASLALYIAIGVVALGAAGVLVFNPVTQQRSGPTMEAAPDPEHLTPPAEVAPPVQVPLTIASILMTALCWGAYGPVLHYGQAKMGGSRLRPFICVGLAYFVLAVAAPLILGLFLPPEPGSWNVLGLTWSLIAGATGALGALGIIYAFTFGGKPLYVMPLVFGGAPVVNTFTAISIAGLWNYVSVWFIASLLMVIAGSVAVLVFAPRSSHK